jgi:hypothetical protein
MPWHPDVPDLPITKPKEIEKLEQMDRVMLESMPFQEVQDIIDEAAHAFARAYHEQVPDGDYEGCIDIVSVALSVTGSALGGKVGTAMIGASQSATKSACRIVFPEEEESY